MKNYRDFEVAEFDYFDLGIWKGGLLKFLQTYSNSTITWSFTGLFKLRIYAFPKEYFALLRKANIPIKYRNVRMSPTSIIIKDPKSKSLYRCSFMRKNNHFIKNNLDFITGSSKLPRPSHAELITSLPFRITKETLVGGRHPKASEWSEEKHKFVIHYLRQLHGESALKETFNLKKELNNYDSYIDTLPRNVQSSLRNLRNYLLKKSLPLKEVVNKAQIHGDLTIRNIIFSQQKPIFIDFDRNTISFPEFDYFLLYADRSTYCHPNPSYSVFFNEIFSLMFKNDPANVLPNYLRRRYKKYSPVIRGELSYLFIYRLLALTLTNMASTSESMSLIRRISQLFRSLKTKF